MAQVGGVYNKPTNSSPIAMSADNKLVWSVNPDNDTVSVIRTDTNELIRTIRVGDEPQSVALDPTNQYAYVANAASNTVTVIRIINPNPSTFNAGIDTSVGINGHIKTGAEPFNIVSSPNGKRIFVANSSQDTITVINATNRTVIGNVNLRNSLCNIGGTTRHFQPRGLAVTQNNTRLYVTRFLSFTKANGVQGNDRGEEGVVCRLNINTNSTNIGDYLPASAIRIAASDTGFTIDANSDGTADPTAAYPNQLQSIVIRNGHAYLPNIAASPSRPLRFNVDTHAFVNRIDGIGGTESDGGAINMHLGARNPELGKKRLFFANPWAIAFTNQNFAGKAYAVSSGSDLLVKLNVANNGVLSFTTDGDTTRYIDLNNPAVLKTAGANAGKNPLGIVINDAGTVAYVMNYISHNVSVVNLNVDRVAKVIQTSALPTPGSRDETVEVGGEVFFSSRGNFVRPGGTNVSTQERLSSEGWQSCASCHFNGLTDGVVWQFGTGPRKSVPLNGTFNPNNPNEQRILNYSAIFDEVQDFENNIRNVSGPGGLNLQGLPPRACIETTPVASSPSNNDPNHGLLFGDNGNINISPCEINTFLTKRNLGRQQHKVQLPGSNIQVSALDALNQWVRLAVRTPNRPLTTLELTFGGGNPAGGVNESQVLAGRQLFQSANCLACHSGGKWSRSTKNFGSPPAVAQVAIETDPNAAGVPPDPNGTQYLFQFLSNIKSFNLNVPGAGNPIAGQPQIGAVEKDTNNRDALGLDYNNDGKGEGYNIPSLLGIHSLPPYYHNGACETLACVVADIDHRTAGLPVGAADPLATASARNNLVRYLESIDKNTPPPA
ncbi:beta-propeller fold lactonase family protein [Synechocystis sp. PCC 7509]|uniref:beta-propeller fold lactonase family protein n=1 Tax=Synechocystis sp. PCC 7509 TaxID=927677 RepID=UPI0002EA7439|nr:beta-propeller fold lactonase family protein [Synechocystis sp. PCC 7509]